MKPTSGDLSVWKWMSKGTQNCELVIAHYKSRIHFSRCCPEYDFFQSLNDHVVEFFTFWCHQCPANHEALLEKYVNQFHCNFHTFSNESGKYSKLIRSTTGPPIIDKKKFKGMVTWLYPMMCTVASWLYFKPLGGARNVPSMWMLSASGMNCSILLSINKVAEDDLSAVCTWPA